MWESAADIAMKRIKRHEGEFIEEPIPDVNGWIVGYGHFRSSKKDLPARVTRQGAEVFLEEDVNKCIASIMKNVQQAAFLNPHRRSVLIEMVYQLGEGGFLGFANMLKYLEEQDTLGAARAMLNSRWYRQTPERCKTLALIMAIGEDF